MKTALVTGASTGIGKAVAIALAKEGYSVAVNFKSNSAGAHSTMEECNVYSQNNFIIKGDLTEETQVIEMADAIKSKFGHIDVLINNAGIFDREDNLTNIDAFNNIYKNNFLSCLLVTKHTLPLMVSGKIVNISSLYGRLGYGRSSAAAYAAFKAALENYTKNLARELAPAILVNAIAPARVLTSRWGNPDEEGEKRLGKVHLINRMITPDEVADTALFLVKNDAICGEIITIDGGMSLVALG